MTTQFNLAQQAANVAYDMTLEQTGDEAQASDDYRVVMDAYNKRVVMAQHRDGSIEIDTRFAMTAERVAAVKPLADETMRRYHEYTAQLSDDEIALMQAMCNETAYDDAKDDATGRPW